MWIGGSWLTVVVLVWWFVVCRSVVCVRCLSRVVCSKAMFVGVVLYVTCCVLFVVRCVLFVGCW